jgi:RNA recognition motif-containing protein
MYTSSQHVPERNQDATIYVGNLTANVSEELLWELFLQSGPVVNVHIPKDKVTNVHQVITLLSIFNQHKHFLIIFEPVLPSSLTFLAGFRVC